MSGDLSISDYIQEVSSILLTSLIAYPLKTMGAL